MSSDLPDGPKPKPEPAPVLVPVAGPPGGLRLVHLMLAIGLCAVVFWLGVLAGLWFLVLVVVLVISCVISLAVVLVQRNTMQQESLLWALAIATERGLPLPPAALAFADQFGGGFRWRCQMLAAALEEGKGLPEAIDEAPGLVSPEAVVLIKAGASSGHLADGLRMAATVRQLRQAAWGDLAGTLAYLGFLSMGMGLIVTFVLYFIVPKFVAIFADFGVELPAPTVFVIQASHFAMKYFYLWLPPLIGLSILLPLSWLNAWRWDVPPFDRIFRRRHSALVMRALALAVKGGKPIVDGLSRLAVDYPARWVRGRLRTAEDRVRGGADWVEALLDQRVIRPAEAAVLSSAQRVGNLEWALEEMGASAERRLGYRLRFWTQLLFPAVVVSFGGFVLVIAVAFFSPLVTLISRLS